MQKPRIILADTDFNYIASLQIFFLTKFADEIVLEIITDKAYFDQFFQQPQEAAILIVSQELYFQNLNMHNLVEIFVLSETMSSGANLDDRIHLLYKYSSINSLFNEILDKSHVELSVGSSASKECRVVIVTSAQGGTGKTTIALGISACLAANYKKVLYVDAEYLHTFQFMLHDNNPIVSADIYKSLQKADDAIYHTVRHVIRTESFAYLPPFKAALLSLGLDFSLYRKLLLSAKASGNYDFIICDTDSSYDDHKASLMELSDQVIIVVNQTRQSAVAANVLAININRIRSDKYQFICNNFDEERNNIYTSSELQFRFPSPEYVDHIRNIDKMDIEDLAKEKSIQRIVEALIK